MADGQDYAALQTPTADDAKLTVRKHGNQNAHEDDGEDRDATPAATTGQLVPLAQLFVFADRRDALLMAVGTLAAVGSGVAQPLQVVFFGDITNSLNASTGSTSDFRAGVNAVARNFALASTAVIVCCFLQAACWALTGSRQAKRIRSAYVGAILTNEIGWYDLNDPMELSTRVADSAVTIQEGMGRKIGDAIQFGSMAVAAITIGFIKGWELALVLMASAPVIAISGYFSVRVLATATQASSEAYGKAGAIAQESLGNIRTVHMFNAIQHFVDKYEKALVMSTKAGVKKGLAVGLGTGMLFLAIFCTYAFGMYFGALMIANDRRDACVGGGCYNSGRVLTVFLSVIFGAAALGQAAPSVQAIFSARAAAYDVFAVINRQSMIDPLSEDGKKLDKVAGNIDIESVSFAYPSRPEVKVCDNYSLTIKAGETVALVGPSGSGKSTIVSLLERFYDPLSGVVKLDGVDVRELNVKWLRAQVGLVGQEPALFATSIMENIRHGCPGATDDQVIEAAKMANAYTFIKEFPEGFDTEVGERGAQLSGGQKQRIAIARAIIKNPPILLLDEATSALDTESERIVQESLDKLLAASSRTTIIVAHRLSTIRNASKIAVHSGGSIVELGTHEELMKNPTGHYRMLVEAQSRPSGGADGKVAAADVTEVALTSGEPGRLVEKSTDVEIDADSDESQLADDDGRVSVSRLWKMSLAEWKFMAVGGVGAVLNAAMYPVWGYLFTKVFVLFFEEKPRGEFLDSTRWLSVAFVCLGVTFLASSALQNYGFAVVSQRLVSRVRLSAFNAMLHQEVGWFDLDENSSGALVARLATDSAVLQAMASGTLNQTLVAVTAIGISFTVAFYHSWEMTLLLLATSPIMIIASTLQTTVMTGTNNNKKLNDADSSAGSLLSEAIGSIRTVASFSMEHSIKNAYATYVNASSATDTKYGILGGIGFGMAQGATWLILAMLFYVGSIWVSNGRITFEDMLMVMMVMMFSSFAIGAASQNATDQAKVKKAASRVFRIIDRTPEIDSTSGTGEVLPNVTGNIEFKGVKFTYPSRPNASIYKNYNLKIASGQTVALVGASGSGKSTAISLLERFYDPAAGTVTLDGADLRKLRLPWLRERISLVSQEPVLFAGTIGENIAMGKPGATREEVEEAAKKANAYDFIMNFPSGFDTDVGDRGAQVSGGQKQRIAIARAILRDPEVLLLDEATSALDNESERVVQASLDRLLALKKRTTIIVAHRLSTIRNADLIAVTKDGAIVEQGTHEQLMALPNGVYKALVARQVSA